MSEETIAFDFLIIGAGPAGLSAAIRLAQLNQQTKNNFNIAVIEKSESIGHHILSGAVLEPKALNELIPDWRRLNPPLYTPVTEDQFVFLTQKKFFKLPVPPQMRNSNGLIISLSEWCCWLATYAENLGVQIFSGFAATEILFEKDQVIGIKTGDKGRDKNNQPTENFQAGIALMARQTIFAEGCRGFLSQQLMKKFNLRKNCSPQTYGLGIKELWKIPETHSVGRVIHTIGWPLKHKLYGGSFIYHFSSNLLAIGFVVGLDYRNPYLNPYEIFQEFKTHPYVAPLLEKGTRLEYGARCLNEGGFQSIPILDFPGGVLVGCAAGFLNVPKIKGIHTAMKSGIVAAENIFHAKPRERCVFFSQEIKKSWIIKELKKVRNIRPAMNWGLWPGLIYAAFDTYILRGRAPWTFHYKADHLKLKKADLFQPNKIFQPDQKITFDLMSSVYLTHAKYVENQPCHLKLNDPNLAITCNFSLYGSPEQYYCPAGVYEMIQNQHGFPKLIIHSSNCIHCKACDIKDPTQNITWTPPEGGCGPGYQQM